MFTSTCSSIYSVMISTQLFIFITCYLQLSWTKSPPSPNTVTGAFRDIQFIDYELDLWTFVVKNNTVISTETFHIGSRRHESVKAFLCNNQSQVHFLPVEIDKKFPNLALFEAKFNSIKSVSKGNFQGLKKLVKLQLDGNEIEELPADAFSDLIKLTLLSLTRNKIQAIHADSFKNLQSLQSLYLGHNKLKFLHKDVFENLGNLRNISLNYNKLTFLSDEHLGRNQALEYIWLEHNDMSHLSYTMFNDMNNLKYIDFTFNLHMWSGFVYEKKEVFEE